jgi:hypothetical protein
MCRYGDAASISSGVSLSVHRQITLHDPSERTRPRSPTSALNRALNALCSAPDAGGPGTASSGLNKQQTTKSTIPFTATRERRTGERRRYWQAARRIAVVDGLAR